MDIRKFVGKFYAARLKDGIHRQVAARYERSILDFLSMFPEKKEPNDFTRFDVEEWTRARGWQGSKAGRAQANICTFWNWLIRVNPERILGNPARFPRSNPNQRDTRYRAFSNEQINALRMASQTDQDHLLLALGLLGLTQAEVAGLSRTSLLNGYICLPDRQIPVEGTGIVGLWPPATDATLLSHSEVEASPPALIAQAEEHSLSSPALFPTQSAVRECWLRIARRAQLDLPSDYNWQRLRRTFVCQLLLAGASLDQVAGLLGCSRHAVAQFVLPTQEKPLDELVANSFPTYPVQYAPAQSGSQQPTLQAASAHSVS